MFNNGTIAATPERVCKVDSLTSAMHNVIERIGIQTPEGMQYALVVATNVYQRTAQGWRMVAHHASPGTSAAHAEAHETPQVLH
jgi:hypothetical protein